MWKLNLITLLILLITSSLNIELLRECPILLDLIRYDVAEAYQLGFQDVSSSIGEEIIWFHDRLVAYILIIALGVLWVVGCLCGTFINKNKIIVHKYWNHGTLIEIIWTITPLWWCGKPSLGNWLPNSGEPLKLMIPSCNWKVTSGWTNYSGKVTSHKMSENEMGNRGSKSKFNYIMGLLFIFLAFMNSPQRNFG
jgi:cytochrome c oxidase subunit 2